MKKRPGSGAGPARRRTQSRPGQGVAVALVVTLAFAAAPATATSDHTPSLGVQLPHQVPLNPMQMVWIPSDAFGADSGPTPRYIGQIDVSRRADDSHEDLTYRIESVAGKGSNRICLTTYRCSDVTFNVLQDTGWLHLYATDLRLSKIDHWRLTYPTNDFVPQRTEVSVEDKSTGLKIFRELLVAPSARAPDCSDYPATDTDRFVCLFNGEMPAVAEPQPVAAELPDKLVRGKEDYALIFAEEFNGEAPAGGSCRNGLATLDGRVWNRFSDACDNVEVDGRPCENIEDGHYYTGKSSQCSPGGISTIGKFNYRYGYLEVRYRFALDQSRWRMNSAMVLGAVTKPRRYKHCSYGMAGEFDSLEALQKYTMTEIDFFEYTAGYRTEYSHQYLNAAPYLLYTPQTLSYKSDKLHWYCTNAKYAYRPESGCEDGQEITVTKGLEWTPRGYRTLIKVDGVHDDFIVLPKNRINLYYKPWQPKVSRPPPGICNVYGSGQLWFGNNVFLRGAEKDAYFEFLDPDDPNSMLEQLGISHAPQNIGIDTHGRMLPSQHPARAPMKIDYIRVYQPRDGYAGMEPIYQ